MPLQIVIISQALQYVIQHNLLMEKNVNGINIIIPIARTNIVQNIQYNPIAKAVMVLFHQQSQNVIGAHFTLTNVLIIVTVVQVA